LLVAIRLEIPKVKGFVKKQTSDWLLGVAESEGAVIQRLHYKSFDRSEMIELNTSFLGHAYDTDIISFAINEHPLPVNADFALGWDQIQEQALELDQPLIKEVHRIVVHGLLHCIGYDDHSDEDRVIMRAKEDLYLSKHPQCSTWNKY
jgi:probable rRNA maturation factor